MEDRKQDPKNGPGKGNDNKPFKITVVVGGDDQKLTVKPDQVALDVLRAALKKAENESQPVEDWQLKDEDGKSLDLSLTLGALGVIAGVTLWASLKVGAAG